MLQTHLGTVQGAHQARPGNHDYETEGASAYFDYFGDAAGEPGKGYYSYDLGQWHIVAALQDPDGNADPQRGIREFVVGTGGRSHYSILGPIANSEVYNDETYGVLKLPLRPESYEWRFIPVEGEMFTDSGSATCH